MSRYEILLDVADERDRQERLKRQGKFPWTCSEPGISNPERLTVLAEEFGEVAREVCEGLKELDRVKLRDELVQVAAVCVAWVEGLDAESP